jgi:hypothetical protein
VLKSWFGQEATDDFIWEVCRTMTLLIDEDEPVCGWDELPLPSLYPRRHRELLRSIVAVKLAIGVRKVDLKALDAAYSIVFPNSTPINVNKKRKNHPQEPNLTTHPPRTQHLKPTPYPSPREGSLYSSSAE